MFISIMRAKRDSIKRVEDSLKFVAAKAKKSSGLDTKTILKIMAILAPILMSKMGKQAKTQTAKAGSSDIFSVVGGLLDGVDAKDVVNILGMLMK